MLIFRHIPKTAGTSINEFICKYLSYNNTNYNSKYYYNEYFLKYLNTKIESTKYLTGHISSYYIDKINKPSISFTFLRDPMNRTISQYNHFKKIIRENVDIKYGVFGLDKVNTELKNYLGKDSVDINKYFKNDLIIYNGVANFQCKYLDYQIKEFYGEDLKYDLYDENMLERAKENLCSLDFFGLQEEMYKSILLLCYHCGFKPTRTFPILNVSSTSEVIDDETTHIIYKNLDLDYKLYVFAKKIFSRRTKDLTYKKVLENYENVMFYNNRICDVNNYDERNVHFNDGWYPSEGTHIWSGPSSVSEIDFSINYVKNIRIVFNVIDNKSGIDVKDMKISVNYINTDFSFDKGNGKVSFIISSRILKLNKKLTTIRIAVGNTTKIDTDSRLLGICIANFKIQEEV